MQGFQRLGGTSDAASLAVAADLSNSGVTSFAQQSFAPGQAPQLSKDLGPAVAIHPEGYAPGFRRSHVLCHRHQACLSSEALEHLYLHQRCKSCQTK